MSFRQMLANAAPDKETALTLGVFDGVHLGHCHLLRRLVQLASPPLIPLVLTFTNHPVTVLRPGTSVGHLTTPEEKIELLKLQGVEAVVIFSAKRARIGQRAGSDQLAQRHARVELANERR